MPKINPADVGWKLTKRSSRDLASISRRLKELDKDFKREFMKALRAGVRPAQAEAKAAAMSLPGSGEHTRRRQIRRAVGTSVRLSGRNPGVSVVVRKKPLGEAGGLPRLMNQGQWRHPVYGNRNVWVTQTSEKDWFDDSIKRKHDDVAKEVEKVLDEVEKKLR